MAGVGFAVRGFSAGKIMSADGILEEIIASEPRVLNPQVVVQPIDDGQAVKVRVIANLTFDPNAILELEQEISI